MGYEYKKNIFQKKALKSHVEYSHLRKKLYSALLWNAGIMKTRGK